MARRENCLRHDKQVGPMKGFGRRNPRRSDRHVNWEGSAEEYSAFPSAALGFRVGAVVIRRSRGVPLNFGELFWFAFLGALLLLPIGEGYGQVQGADDASVAAINQAHELIQQGRLEEAEPLLARAVKLQPASPGPRLEWASILAHLHRYREAEKALAGVAAPIPLSQRIAYYRLKASIDLGTGNPRAAEREMEFALKLAPGDRNLMAATGMAENAAGDSTKAIAHLSPVFAAIHDPYTGLALLQAELVAHRDYTSTLSDLQSLELPVEGRLPFEIELGETLSGSGAHIEAVSVFQKAVEDAPGRADLCFDLALAQFRAGQPGAALASAERTKSIGDSAGLESLIGDIQEAQGDSLAAIHSYQAAVALAPDQEQYRLELGLELLRHGTFEPALAVFQQSLQLFPKSTRVRVAVGLTHYFLEQYPEAAKSLLEAARMDQDSDLASSYLGEIELQLPVSAEPAAVGQVCRYADRHPKSGQAVAYCGALELRVEHDRGDAGPSPEVIERLRQASREAPDNATARCSMGQALEWSRQWRPAESEMEACLRLDPDSVEGHYRMAEIARHLGEPERAQEEVRKHDEAQQHLVKANGERDRTLQKFLYTMSPKDTSAAR